MWSWRWSPLYWRMCNVWQATHMVGKNYAIFGGNFNIIIFILKMNLIYNYIFFIDCFGVGQNCSSCSRCSKCHWPHRYIPQLYILNFLLCIKINYVADYLVQIGLGNASSTLDGFYTHASAALNIKSERIIFYY